MVTEAMKLKDAYSLEQKFYNCICEMPDWMKHKLESRLTVEISITLMAERTKEPLDESESGE